MSKKFTYAVTISALSALSLVSIASASGLYADFTISNGDNNEEVGGSTQDNKVQAAITNEQPTKVDIRGGDDSGFAITVEQPTKLNFGASDPAEQV